MARTIKTTTNSEVKISNHVQHFKGTDGERDEVQRDTINIDLPNGANVRIEIATSENRGTTWVAVYGHENHTNEAQMMHVQDVAC